MKVTTAVNVLLVDDERANLLAFSAVLENLDVNLIYATSGEEALRQALLNDFAVILLDFYMPTMGGLEVAQILRTRSQIPIIFITASGPQDFPIEEAYSLGAVDYLTKPYNPTVLKSKVAFFIELHKRTEALAASERARYLSELNVKEGRIRLILENVRGYAFIVTDVAGNITEWEGDAAIITKWSPTQVMGQSIAVIYTDKDRLAGYPGIELETAKATGVANDKRWHVRKDGSRFYAEGVMVPLKDAADQVHGFSKIFRDATSEQLAAEELRRSLTELQESRALFSLLLESSVEGIYGMGPDSSCMFINTAGATMLGYRPEELVGRPIYSVIHNHHADGSDYPLEKCRISQAAREGRAIRVDDEVFWHKDGKALPVSYSVSPMIAGGKPAGAVITFADITERRQNELEKESLLKEVQTAHNQMADVFKQAPAFMCILRGPGHVVEMANDRYQELIGNRDILNKAVRNSLPELEGQGFFEQLDKVYATGQSYVGKDVRIALQRQVGTPLESRFIDFVYIASKNADGDVNGVLIHGVDQTERRLAELAVRSSEENLRRLAADLSEADRRKSEFLATLAHELRNPLAPIRNGLGILRVGGDNAASLAKTREMMERQVNHMVHLVDDLLDISRISGGKIDLRKEPVALKELITSAVETSLPLIENGQHKLLINILDDAITLNVDPIRITQVIANLLNNAAKYTPTGGQIEVNVALEGKDAVLAVKDNGIGIPADALPTVFEMFNQVPRNMGLAQGGLGIGLTLVRQIVEMHGGKVSASSTDGVGSTFILTLPVAEPGSIVVAEQAIVSRTQPLRIMVVDDNVDAAESLSLLLQLNGHTLYVANSGHEAIDMAASCKPHIIFLDIGMPGMNGYETASALRKITDLDGMVLVALTGWGAEEDRNRSRAAGFDKHLTKPVQLDLIEMLLSTLEPSFA